MTSDERREVAERMRVYSHGFDFGDSDPFCYVAKAAFGDVDVHTYYSVFARLADLIDPTCHMDAIDTGEQADYECREHIMHCSNCNAEFGYVLYGEDGDVSMDDKPKFCPECGKRVAAMAATSEERRKVAENVEAEEQESPDDFDFDASFEITCEEVINSIRESALARLGIGCGARVVNDA